MCSSFPPVITHIFVPGIGQQSNQSVCAHVQSAVDRASQPKEGATVMPEAAEKAKDMLAEEIRDARHK